MGYKWYSSQDYNKVTEITNIILLAEGTSTDARHGIERLSNDKVYYWDGSAWSESDRTYTTLSTLADLIVNIGSLTLDSPTDTIRIFSCVDTDLSSPETEINGYSVTTRQYTVSVPRKCRVKFVDSARREGIVVKARIAGVSTQDAIVWGDYIVQTGDKIAVTDESGEAYLELEPNAEILPAQSRWQIAIGNNKYEKKTVPKDTASVNFVDLE